ncbi:MAG: M18 family aminopeptidase [Bowdeniella nasicola]|nr:M18 family aminopeptidase [Bowdeniella nasicola]
MTDTPRVDDYCADLGDFITASPTSYHAAEEAARRLDDAGFARQRAGDPWNVSPGGHVLVRDGALMAWVVPEGAGTHSAFRIVGTHTDSPTFKLKPEPAISRSGWQSVGVEVYGGPLQNSWLDRDLGLAGRVIDREGAVHLVQTGAICRIPQLAIHLDRSISSEGLKLDAQQHTAPIYAVGDPDADILAIVAQAAGLTPDAITGHDLYLFDTQRPEVIGANADLFASARLDNLSSTHAGLQALLDYEAQAEDTDILVLAAFDHEEVGSGTRTGAGGPLLEEILTRTATALGADLEQRAQMWSRSALLSCDAGHAIHPNYPERHDPDTRPLLNAGPLLKLNAQQRYASDARGTAIWNRACAAAEIDHQVFVSNNAMPCGSTIGPISATRLGLVTVDVGVPLLSMHSARELAGVHDLPALSAAISAFFTIPLGLS